MEWTIPQSLALCDLQLVVPVFYVIIQSPPSPVPCVHNMEPPYDFTIFCPVYVLFSNKEGSSESLMGFEDARGKSDATFNKSKWLPLWLKRETDERAAANGWFYVKGGGLCVLLLGLTHSPNGENRTSEESA